MRMGILTGDDSWGPDNNKPADHTPITGYQLAWIRGHQKETGCPASTGSMSPFGAHCDSCGSDL